MGTGVKTTEIAIPRPPDFVHSVSTIDENHFLYGNYIGVQFVFADHLDSHRVAKAISAVIEKYPALAGVYFRKDASVRPSPIAPVLQVRQNYPGAAADYADVGSARVNRNKFLDEPSRAAAQSGKANLATFTLTNFVGGDAMLGIAISHLLCDAAGYHRILREIADAYSAGKNISDAPLHTTLNDFLFGASRSKPEMRAALHRAALKTPLKINGGISSLWRRAIMAALDRMRTNTPIIISLSAEDVSRLKETVLRESGEDWISTNIALSAHFVHLLAVLNGRAVANKPINTGALIDLRHKYFSSGRDAQTNFVGNAILIHADTLAPRKNAPLFTRRDFARHFKKSFSKIDATYLKERLDLISDCLAHGYTYPGLDMKNPMISVNNQSKMPVYDVDFDGAELLRVIPQDVGDVIMFFPAPDGGIEVYVRDIVKPGRQKLLLTPEWRSLVLDF